MRWMARKLDSLLASAVAAFVALSASQFLAFVQQYRQRLGGHLDEARLGQSRIASGQIMTALEPAARVQAVQDMAARVDHLQQADAALRDAGLLARPVAFVHSFEPDIALATWHDFQPAIPVDAASLTYTAVGLFLGWMIYEFASWPVAGLYRRRRRHRRAG